VRFSNVADDQAKVSEDRLVEPGKQAACRWLYLGRPLKKLVNEWRLVGVQVSVQLRHRRRRWPVLELGVPLSSARNSRSWARQLGIRLVVCRKTALERVELG
jgi:hypothetical protein